MVSARQVWTIGGNVGNMGTDRTLILIGMPRDISRRHWVSIQDDAPLGETRNGPLLTLPTRSGRCHPRLVLSRPTRTPSRDTIHSKPRSLDEETAWPGEDALPRMYQLGHFTPFRLCFRNRTRSAGNLSWKADHP